MIMIITETTYLACCDIDHQLDGRQVVRKRKSVLDELEERYSGGPDVGSDRILLTADSFRLENVGKNECACACLDGDVGR